jgi:tetratricopeptide (TPR) repeat protein
MLEEILSIHQSGRLDEAEQRYREWLAFNPDDPEALHLLAILRRQREDLAEALDLARRAVEVVPDKANYQLTLAGLLLHARQFEAAREGFGTALRLNPNLPGAALGIAQVALLQGDLAGVQEALSRAERIAPGHPQLAAQKASLAQARGQHDEAVKLFIEAVKTNPNDPALQANLGRSFLALGKTAFAEQSLRNAVRLKPDYTVARIALAQLLMREQRGAEAQVEFDQVLASQPDHPLALAGHADLAMARGDQDTALAAYRQAHAAAPTLAGIAAALVQALFAQGQADEAGSVLASAIAANPASPELRKLDLALAVRSGSRAYIEACRRWLAVDPDSAEAQEQLATTLELRGGFEEADAIARAALKRNSRTAFARLILARSALRAGDPEAAQEQLNRLPDAGLAPARKLDRALLRGLARDRLDDVDGATEAWLGGQRLQGALAPLIDLPDPAAIALPAAAAPSTDGPAPVFLIGLPGAGCESVVTLLRHLGARVLSDRLGQRMRPDAIASGAWLKMLGELAHDAGQAAAFRDSYLAGLAAVDAVAGPGVVDWLPFADQRLLALIDIAFPQARVVLVERDPRDCLLTWLGLGTPHALALTDPDRAAAWLARAQRHLDAIGQRLAGPRLLRIASGQLDDPAALAAVLAGVAGAPAAAPEATIELPTITRGRGGLPTRLPDGRWRAYAEPLASAWTQFAA